MYWVIQDNIYHEYKYDHMISTLDRCNIPYSIHKVIPFSGEIINPPYISSGMKVWAVGSLSMQHSCKLYGWSPGCVEVADYRLQRSMWGDTLLNYDAEIWTMKELAMTIRPASEYFVRPTKDNKFISGQIMSSNALYEWARDAVSMGQAYDPTIEKEEIIIGTPKHIQYEARFWIVNSKVVTWSQYKRGNTVVSSHALVDKDMIHFASSLIGGFPKELKRWEPAEVYCLDICQTDDGFKIVEVNNMNSSGFYDCDVQKLVFALEDYYKGNT